MCLMPFSHAMLHPCFMQTSARPLETPKPGKIGRGIVDTIHRVSLPGHDRFIGDLDEA
jgi:hypothetical protein